MVDLLIVLHRGSHSVVNEVLVQCSLNNYNIVVADISLSTELTRHLKVFGESEGGADPAVFVEDTVLHYRLVSTIHALDSRACTVYVAVAGDQETCYGEDTEGVLVVETEAGSRK